MVNSEYSPNNHMTLEYKHWDTDKNVEMLRLVTDHIKTEKMCKNAVNKLPFVVVCSRLLQE